MNVKIDEAGGCRRIVSIDAEAEEIIKDYHAVLSAFRKEGRIPGFRKGKAPTSVVEKNFGPRIEEDAKERIVARLYEEAVKQGTFEPVGLAGVSDVTFLKTTGITFKVEIDVAPKFKLPKYRKFSIKAEPIEVTDAQFKEAFDGMVDGFAKYEDVMERSVKMGDIAQLDYVGTIDGTDISEIAGSCANLGTAADYWVRIDEPEFLPGATSQLVGAAMNEERTVAVNFPADFHVAEVAGKTAEYKMTVKVLREKALPDLDEEFLKRFDVKTEDELRERIRKDLVERAVQTEAARQKEELIDKLLAKTNMDVPQTILDREARNMARNILTRMSREGGSTEDIKSRAQGVMERSSEMASKHIKVDYILKAIAEEEGIEVAEDAVSERIDRMAVQYRTTSNELRKQIEEHGDLDTVRSEVRAEKTLDALLEWVKIK